MKRRVLSILVDNTSGVLSRVAGLFSRRGYNIDSITAGITTNPQITRMTVVCSGDDLVLEQITKQLAKLVDVRHIKVLKPGESVNRELMLIKIKVMPEQRQNITSIAQIFRAKIVDVGKESMVIEVTGEQRKLEAFLDILDEYEILELARTGLAGLSRGADDVQYL
ncbi:MAG TPA: acetolactate synthase small subunit [Candidatus Ruminococcus avistercoris]|nr:acetolactate synthase small subunit [Candidatus Ruminococcus avistercoris]